MNRSKYFVIVLLSAFACGEPNDQSTFQANDETSRATIELVGPDTVSIEALNNAIISQPGNPDKYVDRARYYWAKDMKTKSLEDLDRAIQADSMRADIHFERGEAYYTMTMFDQAMLDYNRCIEIEPENTECLLKLGEMQIHLQNYDVAIRTINSALAVDELLPFGYYMKGRIYKETGDTTLAASSYQTAIEVDPEYYDAYIEIGLLYAAAGSDLALEYYRTASEIRPESVEAKYNMALFLQNTGYQNHERYNEAFDLYDQIMAIDPNNAAAAFNKGFIYLEYLQDYENGIGAFSKAVELYPAYFQAYYNRGLCYESLENNDEALKDYNRALALQPNFTAAAIAKGRVLGE